MAIETIVTPEHDVQIHRVIGTLDFEELRDALRTLYENEAYRPEQHALWDLRKADLTGFSFEQVGSIASLVRGKWGAAGTARAAFLVGDEAVSYGMLRMYEQRLGVEPEGRIQIFLSLDAALAWLRASERASPPG